MLLLTLRGTPTMYYGDEIGMTDVPIGPDQVQDPFEKNVPGLGLGRDPVGHRCNGAMLNGADLLRRGHSYHSPMILTPRTSLS